MPFENKPIPTKKGGLKINNDKSSVLPKENYQEKFDATAKDAIDRNNSYLKQAGELTNRFKALFVDQTLPVNKTSLAKDIEREVVLNLVSLCKLINSDIDQPDAEGAMALNTIIISMMLQQRDQINQLSYSIDLLQKELAKINISK